MRLQKSKCACTRVRPIETFSSWEDFRAFQSEINKDSEYTEIKVESPYLSVGLVEQWYRCRNCEAVWRLVEPDPPFKGLWRQVTLD
jgi:hypothetical protein